MPRRPDAPAPARSLRVPLACYLAVTLVLPALHGGLLRSTFWIHAAWVTLGSVATVVSVSVLVGLLGRSRR